MLKSNRLKQVFLEGGRPAMGFWQMIPGANVSRILAKSGADWVMVDCEHGNIDGNYRTLSWWSCVLPRTSLCNPTLD